MPVVCFRGDIYYYDFGRGAGSIQSGTRPVVVVQNNVGNKHSTTTIIAPITSARKKATLPTHASIKPTQVKNLQSPFQNSMILFEQLTTINKDNLFNKIGWINLSTPYIENALRASLEL